jgi:threonine/homoserine/homoserine lactone efflux protein
MGSGIFVGVGVGVGEGVKVGVKVMVGVGVGEITISLISWRYGVMVEQPEQITDANISSNFKDFCIGDLL